MFGGAPNDKQHFLAFDNGAGLSSTCRLATAAEHLVRKPHVIPPVVGCQRPVLLQISAVHMPLSRLLCRLSHDAVSSHMQAQKLPNHRDPRCHVPYPMLGFSIHQKINCGSVQPAIANLLRCMRLQHKGTCTNPALHLLDAQMHAPLFPVNLALSAIHFSVYNRVVPSMANARCPMTMYPQYLHPAHAPA